MQHGLTPELLLTAYMRGIFPMSEGRHEREIFWVDPRKRGIFPLDGFHISRSLARTLRRENYAICINTMFDEVIAGCADRSETWINETIRDLYGALHEAGFAHSLEVMREGRLIGGIYGIAIGSAFFGESMFSRERDASKIALAYLIDRLRVGGFQLFDTQFITDHLASLGAVEIDRETYRALLAEAVMRKADFFAQDGTPAAQEVIQRNTQTS